MEIQGLVCLLYVAAGTDFPERVPELTLQVSWLNMPENAILQGNDCCAWLCHLMI